ncbi:MAG: glycosyltransferase [Vicinamibacterales bacterium]
MSPDHLPAVPGREPTVSVVVPALNEGPNLELLLPAVRATLDELGLPHEILIVTRDIDDETAHAAQVVGARVLVQQERGYGGALLAGFSAARGAYVITMDADLSHPAEFIRGLWAARHDGEVVIASRYVAGGSADMPVSRYVLSKVLNRVFSRGLSLRIKDMSSGFRLFDARIVRGLPLRARDFNVVQDILVKAYAGGWRVREVPFHYEPRKHGASHARVLKFGIAYIRTFRSLWRLRNSIDCADYEDRAYESSIPLQRYWQHARLRHVTDLARECGPVLDVGCGSSHILAQLPAGSIGLDLSPAKLRCARQFGRPLVHATATALPFAADTFPGVVCSQVIEQLLPQQPIFDELCRVLRPGGRLIIGTLDHARWEWRTLESIYAAMAPSGCVAKHVSRYTRRDVIDALARHGLRLEAERHILGSELILAFRKPA